MGIVTSRLQIFYILLAVIPFVIIIVVGFALDAFDPRTHIAKLLSAIAETDLSEWMKKAGFDKTTKFLFQVFRIVSSITIGFLLAYIVESEDKLKMVGFTLLFAFIFYKFLYYYLRVMAQQRINKLNQLLPYMMNYIIYLCHIYPLKNALLTSIDYVPKEFRQDMITLCKELDEDDSDRPYKNFVNRYEGKLKNLEVYFSMLYRMGESTAVSDDQSLDALDKMVAEEVSRARIQRNDAINKSIALVGLLPVISLVIMLVYIMMLMTELL